MDENNYKGKEKEKEIKKVKEQKKRNIGKRKISHLNYLFSAETSLANSLHEDFMAKDKNVPRPPESRR